MCGTCATGTVDRLVTVNVLSETEWLAVAIAAEQAGLTHQARMIRSCLPCPGCSQPVRVGKESCVMPSDGGGHYWHIDCHLFR